MGFILLIFAFISGLISAYTLSTIDGMDDNSGEHGEQSFESVLKMFGKNQLEEQKDFLRNFVKLSVLLNVPYFILSLLYFFGDPVPFYLAASLIIKMLLDLRLNMRRINKAKNIKGAMNTNHKLGKISELWSMAVYAIHIGFII